MRLGRTLTCATTPVTMTCLPIHLEASADAIVAATALVSSARLWKAAGVRARTTARMTSSFIQVRECAAPHRTSSMNRTLSAIPQFQKLPRDAFHLVEDRSEEHTSELP